MALATVSKINITGHQKNQENILEVLQNLGFSQIEDCQIEGLEKKNINEILSDLEYKIAGIKFCLDFLTAYETQKKSLKEKIDPKINLTLSEVEKITNQFDYAGKTKEVQEIESGINEAKNIKDKLEQELSQIKPWLNLNFIPNRQKLETGFNYKFLIINEINYNDLLIRFQKDLPLTVVKEVNNFKKEIFAVLFFKHNQEAQTNEILNELNVKIAELPDLETLIPARVKQIDQIIDQSGSRIEKLTKEAQRLANHQRELKISFDYLNWQKEKLIQRQKAGRTKQTFSLTGWVDKDLIETLKDELSKVTNDYIIDEIPFEQEEAVPVIFKNTWAGPFEFVTNVYGAPQYHEPDPTPWLTPFFILFFGLCMTDAGYGIILALFSWLGMKILKPTKEGSKMFKVLMWGVMVLLIQLLVYGV